MKSNSFHFAYRDLYLDVTNQVILMNLVARQIWIEDEQARNCLKKIHSVYCALSSKESLREKLGDKLFFKFFLEENKHGDDDFFKKLAYESINAKLINDNFNGVFISMLNDLDTSIPYHGENSVFKNDASRIILTYIFELLDKDGCVSISNSMFDSKYINFIAILSESVAAIKDTYGYGHQNIYMCLYHFDFIYQDLLVEFSYVPNKLSGNDQEEYLEEIISDKKMDMLIEVSKWISFATRIYKCNFSRNTKLFSSANFDKCMANPHNTFFSINENSSISNASSLIINFYDDKPETLLDGGTLEEFSSYSDDLCEMLKVWLIDKWYEKHNKIARANINMQKEYEKYRSDMDKVGVSESRKIAKIFKSIDGSETIIYAIFVFDYLYGTKMSGKMSQKSYIEFVKNKYYESSKKFPYAGVKKQLGELRKRIENSDYTKIRNKQNELSRQNIKENREFFPYPLF